ncbi:MAG: TerB family tellurite resistance protein [SAR324 cluster bacterium]|nr:TerB family tellurite resistance protein [SAR324 cluster bacterium]
MAVKFKTPIQAMDDKQKEWFATAMVSMVLADGNVSQGEVESLVSSFAFVNSPGATDRLKKFLHYKTMPDLQAFTGWQKNLKGRALMLIDLMETAISDRDFSPKEREQFLRIGKMLGFSYDKIEQFIQMGDNALQHME